MNKKCIIQTLSRFGAAFNIQETPSIPELEDIAQAIKDLDFGDYSSDKKNMRRDIYSLGTDFKKSTNEAKDKLHHGECLSFQ